MQEVHVEVGKRVERHPSGHFREVYANGTVYEGNLVNLIREGYGFLTEWDTSEYIGEWKQDMRSGLGVSTINPCKYEGLFEVDSPNGKGRLIAPQYTYAGDFVYGKPHGFGIMKHKTGEVQMGEWVKGNWVREESENAMVAYHLGDRAATQARNLKDKILVALGKPSSKDEDDLMSYLENMNFR